MNKISKKILAIVTMAAFVVTMMPFAAFAAGKTAQVDASYFGTEDTEVTAATYEDVVATFDVADKSGAPIEEGDTGLTSVMVWATLEGESTPSSAATFYNYADGAVGGKLRAASNQQNSYATDVEVKDGYQIAVDFARPGTYVLHAAQVTKNAADETVITEFNYDADTQKVIVEANEVGYITVDNTKVENGKMDLTVEGKEAYQVYANGTEKKNVKVVAYAEQEDQEATVATGKNFTIDTNSNNLTVTKTEATTDRQGSFEFAYSATKAGTYVITIESEDGYTAKLTVKAISNDEAYAASIEGTSEDVTLNVDEVKDADFSDAVQFTIKDQNGKEMLNGKGSAGQPAADASADKRADYVAFVGDGAPDKFKGEAKDFQLCYDTEDEVYTLKYAGSAKLVEGEYNIRVSLYRTGDFADVTLTLGEFDEKNVTDIKVVPTKDRVAYNAGAVGYKVIAVDANGVESNITADNGTSFYMGVDANSELVKPTLVDDINTTADGNQYGVQWTPVNPQDKESVIGSVITLTAVSDEYGILTSAEITLTDNDVVAGLAFDKEAGAANEDNTVKVSVVDEDGNVVKVDGKVKAYVTSSSNEKANYAVTPVNAVKDGKNGSLTVFADQPTTLEIVVAVVDTGDANNSKVYADTLTYTVGEADVNADTIVAMTIGSSDIIVNNDIVSGDAAPFVDSNWRTMVPVRALSEAFGGSAEWDGDAHTVTVENGDKTIVFTADSDKYTVNGEEKTMDTALTIVGGRTYVPVRFVADELGYQITVLKDAQGLTAGVVFQK